MANEHMKRNSKYVISEIKRTMRRHYTPIRWPISRTVKHRTPSAGRGVDEQELSFAANSNATWHRHFGRQSDNFLQN